MIRNHEDERKKKRSSNCGNFLLLCTHGKPTKMVPLSSGDIVVFFKMVSLSSECLHSKLKML
jgi:hypothetical protein